MSAAIPSIHPHAVILASAGSGKTWRLTGRFLAIAAASGRPDAILASTFTRAAAGEIRDRILHRAATAVLDAEAAPTLAAAIGLEPERLDAPRLLRSLVGAWPRLQIRTLDSFMSGVVLAHAPELGVPPGTVIADELLELELRAEALRRMLRTLPGDRAIDLLRQLTAGSAESDIGRAVGGVVTALHRLWRESPDSAWEVVPAPPPLDASRLAGALHALESLAASTANGHLRRGLEGVAADVRDEDWAHMLARKLVAGCEGAEPAFHGKPVPEAILAVLRDVRRHGVALELAGIRDQTLATRELVQRYDAALVALKRERGVATFDDLPHLLGRAATLGTLEEIGYRVDGVVHHMLLDEMQDTSSVQWAALRPFAEELYRQDSGERTFFAVGDLKQSIYGWRGAAPDVLASLPGLIGIEPERLDLTWRCAPVVIEAVNDLFGGLARNAAMAAFPGAAARFGSFFQPHRSHLDGAGFVELRSVAPEGDDGEPNAEEDSGPGGEEAERSDATAAGGARAAAAAAARARAAAEIVADLHRRAPAASIGVLVRGNATVARMLYELGHVRAAAEGPIPASGRGGSPLVDAAPVELVLDALRLAVRPGCSAAAFNVAGSPLGAAIGLPPEAVGDERRRGRVAASLRALLLREGLATVVGDWTALLAGAADARERRRLVQLAELAAAAEAAGETDPAAFVAMVEAAPVADEADVPVKVMTIHQSKGLEFDVVVLPELDFDLARTARELAGVRREGPEGLPTAIVRWVRKERRAALPPELASIFLEHENRLALESLCLLYVAMTRARSGLVMLVDAPRPGLPSRSWAKLLRAAMAPGAAAEPGLLAQRGDRAAVLERLGAASPSRDLRPRMATPPRVERLAHGARAALAAAPSAASRSPAEALRDDPVRRRAAAERGTALHACFALVEWSDGFRLDEEAALHAIRASVPGLPEGRTREFVQAFRQALAREPIRAALARPAGEAVALRERAFVRRGIDGMQQGVIDRLVVHIEGGRPVRAEILDFKTSGDGAPDTAARLEHHRPQMAAYRAAVAEQWGIPPERVTARLAFVDRGEVVAVD